MRSSRQACTQAAAGAALASCPGTCACVNAGATTRHGRHCHAFKLLPQTAAEQGLGTAALYLSLVSLPASEQPTHTHCLQGLVLYCRVALLKLSSPAAINLVNQACHDAIRAAVSHLLAGLKTLSGQQINAFIEQGAPSPQSLP